MSQDKNSQSKISFKSESALRDISVESVAMSKKEKPPTIYFSTKNTENDLQQKDESSAEKATNEGFFLKQANDTTENKRKAYNANLTMLDPRYSSLTPLGSFIVRLYIRDEVRTKSGLYLPDATVKSKSHSGMADWEARDPFGFTQSAVIVSTPKFETELFPGDVVQIVRPQMLADKDSVLGYDIQYVHPDYQINFVPTDPEDADFGYGIIPRSHIKVLIKSAKS